MGGVGGRENTPPSLHTPFGAVCQLVWEVSPLHDRVVQLLLKKKKLGTFGRSYFLLTRSFRMLCCCCDALRRNLPGPVIVILAVVRGRGFVLPTPQSAEGKFFFFFLPCRGHIIIATIPCPLCPCLIAGIKNPRDFHRNGHYNYPISSPSGSLPPSPTDVRGLKKIPKAKLNSGLARGKTKSKTKSPFYVTRNCDKRCKNSTSKISCEFS